VQKFQLQMKDDAFGQCCIKVIETLKGVG